MKIVRKNNTMLTLGVVKVGSVFKFSEDSAKEFWIKTNAPSNDYDCCTCVKIASGEISVFSTLRNVIPISGYFVEE